MTWEYISKDVSLATFLEKEIEISNLTATLLLSRGIDTVDRAKKFLETEISDFSNPFLFENMEKIIDKILEVREKQSKVFIYGDYDVDGITAAVFLVKVFNQIGINVDYYIPSRVEEGHGLDKKNLKYMRSRGAELVITVDSSINSIEDVRYGQKLGIDVIVTDHHKSVEKEEDEEILYINPKLSKRYDFKYLSGAGVALKLAQALYLKLGISLDEVHKFIDIVMIGTVADVVPMVGENRIIIKKGLEKIKNTEIPGLKSLLKYLKFNNKTMTTTDISYFVSPLINALGRIGVAKIGADFFIEKNEKKIFDIIEEMKKMNRMRREYEKIMYDEAIERVKEIDLIEKKAIFLSSDTWHPGVVGVVSSRLSNKYEIPVVLISFENGFGKASSRSVPGINIFDIFKKCSPMLERFGGHDLAAGFIVKEENLLEVEKQFYEEVKKYSSLHEKKILKVDFDLNIEQITSEILGDIEKIAPYGQGNRMPLFFDSNLEFLNIKKFGVENKHFGGIIVKDGQTFSVVGFDMGKYIDETEYKIQKFDILYYPERFIYKGNESIQIKIKDMKIKDDFYDVFTQKN